jgi:hypothetical protein
VGRFIIALDLDESWIDKFLDVEETEDGGETKAEREADQVIDRLRHEGAGDDLLIQLANNFTEGEHKDRETAYRSVRAALAELAANKDIAAMAGNADAQFAALIREVDRLNNEGDFDEAARRLDDEQDRQEQVAELHHKKQLSQDRLRNRPDLAAERIIKNLRQFPQGGGSCFGPSTTKQMNGETKATNLATSLPCASGWKSPRPTTKITRPNQRWPQRPCARSVGAIFGWRSGQPMIVTSRSRTMLSKPPFRKRQKPAIR